MLPRPSALFTGTHLNSRLRFSFVQNMRFVLTFANLSSSSQGSLWVRPQTSPDTTEQPKWANPDNRGPGRQASRCPTAGEGGQKSSRSSPRAFLLLHSTVTSNNHACLADRSAITVCVFFFFKVPADRPHVRGLGQIIEVSEESLVPQAMLTGLGRRQGKLCARGVTGRRALTGGR